MYTNTTTQQIVLPRKQKQPNKESKKAYSVFSAFLWCCYHWESSWYQIYTIHKNYFRMVYVSKSIYLNEIKCCKTQHRRNFERWIFRCNTLDISTVIHEKNMNNKHFLVPHSSHGNLRTKESQRLFNLQHIWFCIYTNNIK